MLKNKTAPIVMTPIADLYLAAEAPKNLDLVVRDSSSGSPLTDAELKASIYNHGIIHPLIFRNAEVKTSSGPVQRKFVVAGNRRLRLLREIFFDATATVVQTQDVDAFEADWREIAMDTNLSLPPHLVERYEIIVALVKDLKLSPEDARLRYGMTPRQFNQVMALGKMSPLIREKWKAGEIDAATAQAFTLEPDPKEQDRIFTAAQKRGHNSRVDVWFVRERIIPAAQRNIGKFVVFVGLDVCKKAKIIKQEDLFTHDHIVTDVKALTKLVDEKLSKECAELTEAGWSWALPINQIDGSTWEYGSVTPAGKILPTAVEKARIAELKDVLNGDQQDLDDVIAELDKIEETIKARGFTPAQRAKSGCFLEVATDGSLKIEYGKVKPAEKKKVAASERPKKPKAAKGAKAGDTPMSAALTQRLSEQLQKAGAEALKVNHVAAVAALIAAFASNKHTPLDVRICGERGKPSSFGDVFTAAFKSTPEQREAMLAQIAAQAFSIITYNPESLPLDNEDIMDVFEAMSGNTVVKEIADAFDIKDYFASVSGDTIVEAVRCVLGDEHAAKVAKMDKGTKAKFAVENLGFAKTGWLPKPLRTVWYTGPSEGKPEKPAKKAVAKRAAKKTRK